MSAHRLSRWYEDLIHCFIEFVDIKLTVMKKYIDLITRPLINQLPFIVIFMLLMGLVHMIQWIHGRMVTFEEGITVFRLVGNVAIWFLAAYTLAAVIELSGKKWLKFLIYSLSIIMFTIQSFLWANFDTPITFTILTLVSETDQRESEEFLNAFLFSNASKTVYVKVIEYIIIIFFAEWLYSKFIKRHLPQTWIKVTFLLVTLPLLFLGAYSSKIYVQTYKGQYTGRMDKPDDPFSCTYFSLCVMHVEKNRTKNEVQATLSMEDASLNTQLDDSLNLVVIIGESYIKHHAQIYGYPHETTPFLKNEIDKGNLILFNDVVTPANNTTIVLKNVLCCNDVGNGEQWYDHPFFPAIFKQAGYNVLLWDNQLTLDVNTSGFFGVRNFLYDEELQKLGFTSRNPKGFNLDGELIDAFANDKSKSLAERNLVLFHLQGQHINAATRFPHNQEFTKFTVDSIHRNDKYLTNQKKQRIADYDNATYYNDWVLNRITDLFKSTNSILLYFSDHGDEVYDYRDQFGREFGTFTPNKLKFQFEVPFMIWCSEQYQLKHADTIIKLRQVANRPFMIDKVCHLLFHLGGIETTYYKKQADILDDSYICGKRIVNYVHDYDQIMNKRY